MPCFVGIDPGVSGAVAVIDTMVDVIDIYDFSSGKALIRLQGLPKESRVVLEKVGAMPKQGVVSTFTFGTNFGQWIGRLEALGLRFDLVAPGKWKKEMLDSARKKGVDPKAASLDRARRLFPQAAYLLTRKKDHNRAEALLMAEYCRRRCP